MTAASVAGGLLASGNWRRSNQTSHHLVQLQQQRPVLLLLLLAHQPLMVRHHAATCSSCSACCSCCSTIARQWRACCASASAPATLCPPAGRAGAEGMSCTGGAAAAADCRAACTSAAPARCRPQTARRAPPNCGDGRFPSPPADSAPDHAATLRGGLPSGPDERHGGLPDGAPRCSAGAALRLKSHFSDLRNAFHPPLGGSPRAGGSINPAAVVVVVVVVVLWLQLHQKRLRVAQTKQRAPTTISNRQ